VPLFLGRTDYASSLVNGAPPVDPQSKFLEIGGAPYTFVDLQKFVKIRG
jgi:hypothetical protein